MVWPITRGVRVPVVIVYMLCALGVSLGVTPTASADQADSSNWAGYAVHGKKASFTQIAGQWKVPTGNCVAGQPTYSAMWVGIGGLTAHATGLEQIGTELDCNAAGQPVATAWMELVPAPSAAVPITVAPGDQMSGTVAVRGQNVTLTLEDLTNGQSFTHAWPDLDTDTSSAEWIMEAPSSCPTPTTCQNLPLANFGAATFSLAQVWTTTGIKGGISNKHWYTTELHLMPKSVSIAGDTTTPTTLGEASPSRTRSGGTGFSLLFSAVAAVFHSG